MGDTLSNGGDVAPRRVFNVPFLRGKKSTVCRLGEAAGPIEIAGSHGQDGRLLDPIGDRAVHPAEQGYVVLARGQRKPRYAASKPACRWRCLEIDTGNLVVHDQ